MLSVMLMLTLGPDELVDTYDPNYVPFSKILAFLYENEANEIRPFYADLFSMKKVFANISFLRKMLTQHLRMPAIETCMFMALTDWVTIVQRIVYLATYLDQQPP